MNNKAVNRSKLWNDMCRYMHGENRLLLYCLHNLWNIFFFLFIFARFTFPVNQFSTPLNVLYYTLHTSKYIHQYSTVNQIAYVFMKLIGDFYIFACINVKNCHKYRMTSIEKRAHHDTVTTYCQHLKIACQWLFN